MALIKCPNCNNDISDKATVCPKCNTELLKNESVQTIICEECGQLIPKNNEICPNCGCPINEPNAQKVEVVSVNVGKSNKKAIITTIVILLILGACGFGGKIYYDKQEQIKAEQAQIKLEEDYYNNLILAKDSMLLGAAGAEVLTDLTHSVWSNAIYEKDDIKTNKYTKPKGYYVNDFNEALTNLFEDKTHKETITSLKENQEIVNDLMKKLVNPPQKYSEAYNSIKNLYDSYIEFTNLAINPKGSLASFTSESNSADSKFNKYYEAMQVYIK